MVSIPKKMNAAGCRRVGAAIGTANYSYDEE